MLHTHWTAKFLRVGEFTAMLGSGEECDLPFELIAFLRLAPDVSVRSLVFKACVYRDHIYRASTYCSRTRRIDSYLYHSSEFHRIQDIFVFENQVYLRCVVLTSEVLVSRTDSALSYPLFRVHDSDRMRSLLLDRVYHKCYCYQSGNDVHLLPLPTMDFRT